MGITIGGKYKSALNKDIDVYILANAWANTIMSIEWVEKIFLFTAHYLRNKNVPKLEAGMLAKIRTF